MPIIELCLPQKKALYLNFEKYYSEEKPKAEANEVYNTSLIQLPTDWMCAVTRFHLPLSALPMHDIILISMTLRKNLNPDIPLDALPQTFSIGQLVNFLNIWAIDVVQNGAQTTVNQVTRGLSLKFTLVESYAILIHSHLNELWNDGWYLEMNPLIAHLFAMEEAVNYTINANTVDDVSLIDRWDRVKGVKVSAIGLPVQAEYLQGNARGVILTDFLMPGGLSCSFTESAYQGKNTYGYYGISFSESPRQAINYTPEEYRYLNMNGASRIDDVTLIAEARIAEFDPVNSVFKNKIIPQGDPFTCKLGFFTKNMPERKLNEHRNQSSH